MSGEKCRHLNAKAIAFPRFISCRWQRFGCDPEICNGAPARDVKSL